jgi:hypothetical protein
MGPQVFGGADGELLLETEADARGSWYRSDVVRTGRLSGDYLQEREVIVGPFLLLDVIPGPTDADAKLWPTRFRIQVDVFPLSPAPKSTQQLHQERIIFLR